MSQAKAIDRLIYLGHLFGFGNMNRSRRGMTVHEVLGMLQDMNERESNGGEIMANMSDGESDGEKSMNCNFFPEEKSSSEDEEPSRKRPLLLGTGEGPPTLPLSSQLPLDAVGAHRPMTGKLTV